MSQRPPTSACVPPPSDYAPQPRTHNSSARHRDRPNRGGHHNRSRDRDHHHHSGPITFQSDRPKPDSYPDGRLRQQTRDRFHRSEDDDYFVRIQDEEEEEDDVSEKPCDNSSQTAGTGTVSDEEDDPLDAYMRSLEDDTSKKKSNSVHKSTQNDGTSSSPVEDKSAGASSASQETDRVRGVRLDIDETDDIEESYYKYVEEMKCQSDNQEEEEKQDLVEYDKDGNIICVRKVKREVEPLPPVDHSTIKYETFEKSFYQEHEEISKLTTEQSDELRAKLEIKVSGNSPPRPVCSFAHFKFDEKLMRIIRKSEYYQPTPIQAQAIPAALQGRNMIGIAITGSGKTAAYLWPMIVHIMNQRDLKKGDGPIGLVLVPTRELALQVYGEAKKFSGSHKLAVVCAYGGGSKYEQSKDLEAGAEIVVATPGRIIDLIKTGATNLRRVTYLVLDEADRFFEMGFEAQVRSICDQIRPDRQTLLFSATFKYRVEQLARTVTDDPVKIIQKSLGEANEDVTQHVVIFQDITKKWDWLKSKLVEFTSSGSVLIFVTRIINSEELQKKLNDRGKETLLLHGDMEQSERNRVITAFKRKDCDVMIATDVAARGLDISHLRTVINYDVARDIDTHIHRIGRTGRAGSKGDAYTLLSVEKDKEFAGHLVKVLESSNQKVGEDLLQLAMRSHTFRKSRERQDRRGDRRHTLSSGSHHHHYHHCRNYHNDFRSSEDQSNRSHGHSRMHSSSRHSGHGHQHNCKGRHNSSGGGDHSQGGSRGSDRPSHDQDRDLKRTKWHS